MIHQQPHIRPEVLQHFQECVPVANDESPVSDFEKRRHRQLIADQLARESKKPDLFDGPEAA